MGTQTARGLAASFDRPHDVAMDSAGTFAVVVRSTMEECGMKWEEAQGGCGSVLEGSEDNALPVRW